MVFPISSMDTVLSHPVFVNCLASGAQRGPCPCADGQSIFSPLVYYLCPIRSRFSGLFVMSRNIEAHLTGFTVFSRQVLTTWTGQCYIAVVCHTSGSCSMTLSLHACSTQGHIEATLALMKGHDLKRIAWGALRAGLSETRHTTTASKRYVRYAQSLDQSAFHANAVTIMQRAFGFDSAMPENSPINHSGPYREIQRGA